MHCQYLPPLIQLPLTLAATRITNPCSEANLALLIPYTLWNATYSDNPLEQAFSAGRKMGLLVRASEAGL